MIANNPCDLKKTHEIFDQFNHNCDATALKKAHRSFHRWVSSDSEARAQTLVINYNVIKSHTTESVGSFVNLSTLINDDAYKFIPPGSSRMRMFDTQNYAIESISPRGSNDYGIASSERRLRIPRDNNSKTVIEYSKFADAPIAILLSHRKNSESIFIPQAIISGVVTDPHTFFVVQIQGIRGYIRGENGKLTGESVASRGLIGLNMPLLMIEVAREYARCLGFEKIGWLSDGNNPWLGSSSNKSRVFSYADARRIYDISNSKFSDRIKYDTRQRSWYALTSHSLVD
jgi:hypothetical protein